MNENTQKNESIGTAYSAYRIDGETDDRPAWVEIETGRYQPQRIKGSCHGRELG